MKEIIRKRKSIRKYEPAPLNDATLEKVRNQIENVKPLYPEIRYSIEITNKTKGFFNVKAPHFLVFGSEEKDGSLENIGFIGQQMDLFFSANGLGSCWLGIAKPSEREESALPHVICMSFGNPAEPLHRGLSEFDRKPLSEICEGEQAENILEAVRLAPSGMNAQNWYFIAENEKIHCYKKNPSSFFALIYKKLSRIDMGIALCHISEVSENFRFEKIETASDKKGHVYMETVFLST